MVLAVLVLVFAIFHIFMHFKHYSIKTPKFIGTLWNIAPPTVLYISYLNCLMSQKFYLSNSNELLWDEFPKRIRCSGGGGRSSELGAQLIRRENLRVNRDEAMYYISGRGKATDSVLLIEYVPKAMTWWPRKLKDECTVGKAKIYQRKSSFNSWGWPVQVKTHSQNIALWGFLCTLLLPIDNTLGNASKNRPPYAQMWHKQPTLILKSIRSWASKMIWQTVVELVDI